MVRETNLTIRLSEEERKALDAAARHEDVPASIVARRAIKRELERLGVEIKPAKSTKRPR